jgi:hypothetical protein
MFHWICPECGREIAPTIRECPVCDPVAATVETALAGEVEAPARAGIETPEPGAIVSAPAVATHPEPKPRQPIAPSVAASSETAPVDIEPVQTSLPQILPPPSSPPALAAHIESVSPLVARSSASVTRQDAGDEVALPQFGAPSPGGDPLGHLSSMLMSSMLDSTRDPNSPEPPLSREALPLPMRAASSVPASLRAFIAELRPAGAAPRIPLTPKQQRQTAPVPPRLTNPLPLPLRSSQQAPTPPLGAKLLALPLQPQDSVRPTTSPLQPAPALAPLRSYSPLEGRPLRPAIPQVQLLKKECGPRTTLPGPMLTRRLVKFLDRELVPISPGFLKVKKRLIPGWMATALILGTLLGAGFTSVISIVRPAVEAKPSAAAQTTSEAAPTASAPEVASVNASTLAKAIEVTGFRIQMDPTKKSEIQYLVVNHTPARFSGVTVYVTLYAADAKAGQPPLCKFQFTAPNLAPFQAKDMSSAIERVARPGSLPEWQDVRASVEIGE